MANICIYKGISMMMCMGTGMMNCMGISMMNCMGIENCMGTVMKGIMLGCMGTGTSICRVTGRTSMGREIAGVCNNSLSISSKDSHRLLSSNRARHLVQPYDFFLILIKRAKLQFMLPLLIFSSQPSSIILLISHLFLLFYPPFYLLLFSPPALIVSFLFSFDLMRNVIQAMPFFFLSLIRIFSTLMLLFFGFVLHFQRIRLLNGSPNQ